MGHETCPIFFCPDSLEPQQPLTLGDADWPHTVSTAQGRQDLMQTTKRKWMHDNIKRLYKLEV